MKKIFIKDERLREIHHDLSVKLTEMSLSGKLKGSYTVEESTKGFKDGIYFGWEITDYEDDWKFDDLDNFVITIKKDKKLDNYYFVTCEQFYTENIVCPLMVCGETVEGTLIRFIKELRAQRKTLCVRGKAIEGELAKAIYER
jgi:hypothetical protein